MALDRDFLEEETDLPGTLQQMQWWLMGGFWLVSL